ncbi:MAG: GumC family protein [Nitrospinales bacterium]
MSLNETEDVVPIGDYFRIIQKRKFTLINCVVLTIAAAAIYSFKMKPVYQAKTLVLIERNAPKAVSLQETMALDAGDMQYYKTQYALLRSRALAKSVIQRLHLENSDELEKEKPLIDLSCLKESTASLLAQVGILEEQKAETVQSDVYSSLVDVFLKKLHVSPIRNSRLVDVGFQGYSPPLVAEIANTTAEMYILKNIELRSFVEEGAGNWLQARIAEVQKKVKQSESALSEFLAKKGMIGLRENEQDIATQKLSEINKEAIKAEAERVRLETLSEQLRNLENDPEILQSIPDYVKSEAILQLNKDYLALQREYAEKSKKFRPKHPVMVSVARRIKALEKEIPKEVDRLLKSVEIDFRSALARERSMRTALKRQKQTVINSHKDFIEYNALKREAESNGRLYDVLLKRLKETSISAKSNESNIRIVDPAETPDKPIKPRIMLNIALAGSLGLFGGVFLIFFIESLDKTIRTQEDVESKLQFPFLGAVGLFDKEDEASVMQSVNARRNEDFRIIRTNILHAAPDNPKKVLMLSSAFPGEGKTTIVSKLGVAFAQLEKKVLIIDTDLRKSRLHNVFEVNPQPGLSEYLADENDLKSVIHKTRIENLFIIPRGALTPHSSEILSSNKFKKLLAAASAYFDIVFLDTPPVFQISDALIVSKYCDGIIFLVKSGGSDIKFAQKTLRQLSIPATEATSQNGDGNHEKNPQAVSSVNKKVLGVVLNRVDYKKDSYYYSYYGKRYNGYYDQKASGVEKEKSIPT